MGVVKEHLISILTKHVNDLVVVVWYALRFLTGEKYDAEIANKNANAELAMLLNNGIRIQCFSRRLSRDAL
jgi:hypothetical protein